MKKPTFDFVTTAYCLLGLNLISHLHLIWWECFATNQLSYHQSVIISHSLNVVGFYCGVRCVGSRNPVCSVATSICWILNFFVSVWILQLPDFLPHSKFFWPGESCRHRVHAGLMTHGSLLKRGQQNTAWRNLRTWKLERSWGSVGFRTWAYST